MTSVRALPVENLVIVGMEAVWAGCDGLEAFEQMIYQAEVHETALPGTGNVSLLVRSARSALSDAGFNPEQSSARVVVMAACGDPRVDILRADWNWAGQIVDLSDAANPLVEALEQARALLTGGQADVVVFAAGAGLPNLPSDIPLAEQVGFGLDKEIHGWRFGEGAGAVALMLRGAALARGHRIYASFASAAVAAGETAGDLPWLPLPPALDTIRACCGLALEQAGVTAAQVGYVETLASGLDALDAIEVAGLAQTYRQPYLEAAAALGSAASNAGYLGAASGLAGLVRAALCLYQRVIPGAPGWTAPKLPALWRAAPFYIPGESRAWFASLTGPGRFAALNLVGRGGSFAHLVLCESSERVAASNTALASGGAFLFPLAGDSLEALTQELQDLHQSLMFAGQPDRLAAECFEESRARGSAQYGLSIVGRDVTEITREIQLALTALPQAFAKNVEWQTPLGSCCAPEPVGGLGSAALVYPGAFNSYPGIGKDLFHLFPALYERMARVTTDIGAVMRERLLYPRSLSALSKEELAEREAALLGDPVAMLNSGTALAILYTYILRDIFGLRPSAAFGYSLGETSMMYATGVWAQGDQAAARLAESEVFRARLAGPQNAIRAFWGMPEVDQPGDAPLWSNHLVMAAPDRVQEAMQKEPRVFLTHVNTPRQVVIGGDPQACQRVIAALRASALQAPFDYALHCSPMRSEYDGLVDLHDWPVEQAPGLRMYSAADYGLIPTPYEHGAISRKIAHMLTAPLDFPRLIGQVYADGTRVFIEAGAGSNCARWIDETLKGQPHLAISLNRRGTDDHSSLLRTLARLHAHRVPVDLTALYRPILEKVNA